MAESRETPKETERHNTKRESPRPARTVETEQLVVTLSVPTGEIVKVEKLERGGHRRELTDEEYVGLAVDDETDKLEETLEDAYEAGVADALGENDVDGEDDGHEAFERLAVGRLLVRKKLRRELRRRLMRRAVWRQMLKRELLRRTVRP